MLNSNLILCLPINHTTPPNMFSLTSLFFSSFPLIKAPFPIPTNQPCVTTIPIFSRPSSPKRRSRRGPGPHSTLRSHAGRALKFQDLAARILRRRRRRLFTVRVHQRRRHRRPITVRANQRRRHSLQILFPSNTPGQSRRKMITLT